MDACCELIIPFLPDIEGLILHEETFTWEGREHPQGDVYYQWGKFVCLKATQIPGHIKGYTEQYFSEIKPITFSIQEEGLRLLELEANGRRIDWGGKNLDELLRKILTSCKRWIIVYELNCDQIDNTYQLHVDECIAKLKDNLKFDNEKPEGFITFGI